VPDYEGELRTVGKPTFQVPTGLLTVLLDCNPRYWRGRFLNCELRKCFPNRDGG
jgi:hypothetical protein